MNIQLDGDSFLIHYSAGDGRVLDHQTLRGFTAHAALDFVQTRVDEIEAARWAFVWRLESDGTGPERKLYIGRVWSRRARPNTPEAIMGVSIETCDACGSLNPWRPDSVAPWDGVPEALRVRPEHCHHCGASLTGDGTLVPPASGPSGDETVDQLRALQVADVRPS